jgi:hypothetical protein
MGRNVRAPASRALFPAGEKKPYKEYKYGCPAQRADEQQSTHSDDRPINFYLSVCCDVDI